jgi:signal peptidase II
VKKGHLFWPLATVVVVTDFVTKRVAESSLSPGQPNEVWGEVLRFTLGYNTGIAFGIPFGVGARPLLILFTILAVAGIVWIYRTTHEHQKLQLVGLALILGGALGNLLDRFRSASGVVDFIDVGLGDSRFWTFNIADSGITVGAVLLILSSFMEAPGRSAPSQPNPK